MLSAELSTTHTTPASLIFSLLYDIVYHGCLSIKQINKYRVSIRSKFVAQTGKTIHDTCHSEFISESLRINLYVKSLQLK